MGFRAQQAVKAHSTAKGRALLVQRVLADFAADGDQWIVYVKNGTVYREWGLEERTFQRGLRELEDLGEIRRRQDLEQEMGHQRVYELVPGASLQLALPLETSRPVKAVTPSDGRQTPRPLARARHERTVGTEEPLPPSPPEGVAHTLVVPGVRKATRRRRGRRGGDTGATGGYEWITEPCPLQAPDRPVLEAAQGIWDEISQLIKATVGELTYDVWFRDDVHVHSHQDGLLVVAFQPECLSWIEGRYSQLLERIQQQRQQHLKLVACEALWRQPARSAVSA